MLPVRDQLQHRGMDIQTPCPLCSAHVETVDHTLVSCHFATGIWFAVSKWCNTDLSCFNSFSDDVLGGCTLNQVQRSDEPYWQAILYAAGWSIWKARNASVMQSTPLIAAKILTEIQLKSYSWISNRSKTNLTWTRWLLAPLQRAAQGIG